MERDQTLSIDPVYNGPPDSAHGGVAAGRMAELLEPLRASVRFRAPVPIATPMTHEQGPDGTIELSSKGRPISTVRPLEGHLDVEPFERLDPRVVAKAEADFDRRWGDGQHPFPTCFGCGHGRQDDLGMALRSGPAPGHDVHAASWTPGLDGQVPSWLVWAALDCPSGFPAFVGMPPDRARVTGELAVDIRHFVPGDGTYQILSHVTGSAGRKTTTAAALVDEHGTTLAVATAVWIEVPR